MPRYPRAKCDACARDGGMSFALVKAVKADGRWTTRSAGTIYLCEDCWQRGPNRRRMWRRGQSKDPSNVRRRRAREARAAAALAATSPASSARPATDPSVEREDPSVDYAGSD